MRGRGGGSAGPLANAPSESGYEGEGRRGSGGGARPFRTPEEGEDARGLVAAHSDWRPASAVHRTLVHALSLPCPALPPRAPSRAQLDRHRAGPPARARARRAHQHHHHHHHI
eukprot:scaffold4007_cov362-Prasinococcus_capsulatus_cf.AAC.5